MDWYRIRPAQFLGDIRIHRLSLETQGLLVQLTAIAAQYDGALSLDALFDDVRPPVTGRRREQLRGELSSVLPTYIADVEDQAVAYADKSTKARAAINARWRRVHDTSVCTKVSTAVHTEREKERKREIPPTPQGDDSARFGRFWEAYPRKADKEAARKAWRKLTPDDALLDDMIAALDWQRDSSQWTGDSGRFIPLPSTWLNKRRWEDARPADQQVRKLPAPDWEAAS